MSNMDFLQVFQDNGIQLNLEQKDQLINYEKLLLEWNNHINLTAITEHQDVWIKHFFDSMIATKYLDLSKGKIVDLGTGAGFPGLPLKIFLPSCNVRLIDSLRKRVDFLKVVIENLNLDKIEAIHARAEEVGIHPDYRESADFAVSRAVAAINILVEYCLPLVKVGGYFIAYKGPDYEEELASGKKAIETLGGKIVDIKKYQLPLDESRRTLLIIEKVKETPSKYPRKPGLVKKNPL